MFFTRPTRSPRRDTDDEHAQLVSDVPSCHGGKTDVRQQTGRRAAVHLAQSRCRLPVLAYVSGAEASHSGERRGHASEIVLTAVNRLCGCKAACLSKALNSVSSLVFPPPHYAPSPIHVVQITPHASICAIWLMLLLTQPPTDGVRL